MTDGQVPQPQSPTDSTRRPGDISPASLDLEAAPRPAFRQVPGVELCYGLTSGGYKTLKSQARWFKILTFRPQGVDGALPVGRLTWCVLGASRWGLQMDRSPPGHTDPGLSPPQAENSTHQEVRKG